MHTQFSYFPFLQHHNNLVYITQTEFLLVSNVCDCADLLNSMCDREDEHTQIQILNAKQNSCSCLKYQKTNRNQLNHRHSKKKNQTDIKKPWERKSVCVCVCLLGGYLQISISMLKCKLDTEDGPRLWKTVTKRQTDKTTVKDVSKYIAKKKKHITS